MVPDGVEPIDTQSQHQNSQYDLDTGHDSDDRTRERARENADGTLARLWRRLRNAIRRG